MTTKRKPTSYTVGCYHCGDEENFKQRSKAQKWADSHICYDALPDEN